MPPAGHADGGYDFDTAYICFQRSKNRPAKWLFIKKSAD
jgi:hypothetical protein